MRIGLIHALRHSMGPVEASFARIWPDVERFNLLDDSLSTDRARDGELTPAMTQRFVALAHYALQTGATGILFTCSGFGPCIEAAAGVAAPVPVLKPTEAMIAEAVVRARSRAVGRAPRVGLLGTFQTTLDTMVAEFAAIDPEVVVVTAYADGALAALDRGDLSQHDRLAAVAALPLSNCDVIALAQSSLARAVQSVVAATGLATLSAPESAIRKLRTLLVPSNDLAPIS